MAGLPEQFIERLKGIIPEGCWEGCLASFSADKPLTVRVNTLRISRQAAVEKLKAAKLAFLPVPWFEDAFVLQDISSRDLSAFDLMKTGELYQQNLSSILIPLLMDPKPGEDVLDLCAAPGSKTTQIAAMMNNEGKIICVENVKNRFYRLRSVLEILGVKNAEIKFVDGRRYRTKDLYDKVLLDAPCSSEGRFRADNPETLGYWSLRKIKEMQHKQRGLLLNAGRLLKKGGTLVYSTCTFAPEENEAVVDWFLRKSRDDWEISPVDIKGIPRYPAVLSWQEKYFDERIKDCLRILPSETMDGFFVAKLVKIGTRSSRNL